MIKKAILTGAALCLSSLTMAVGQTAITADYTQNFNSIGNGLPAGWNVYTSASASSLGSTSTFATAEAVANGTTGGFKNFTNTNGVSSDRVLGVRQTGSFGDPGAAFAFNFSTLNVSLTSISLNALILDSQPRSTTWTIQYGIGASPSTWVTLGTFADPNAVGSTALSYSSFGTALNNQANVWFRVVALGASTGSGNRDSFGIDNFAIDVASAPVPEPHEYAFAVAGLLGVVVMMRRRRSLQAGS